MRRSWSPSQVKTWRKHDFKWPQVPKHQHVKLRGLGGLPTRSTQSERYYHSSEQHDLSVQIQRLKWPLMAKVWLPKLWALTIASIWTYGRPNSGQGARRYGPRNASCADKSEIRQTIFQGCFGILSSFPRKAMNTKVEDNFVAYNLDTDFALFGVRTWEIWCRQGRSANQENLDKAEFIPSSLLFQGRSRAR
jgi:hypothetical protein